MRKHFNSVGLIRNTRASKGFEFEIAASRDGLRSFEREAVSSVSRHCRLFALFDSTHVGPHRLPIRQHP